MDQVMLDKLIADLKGFGTLEPSGEKLTTVKGLYDCCVAGIAQVELLKTDAGVALGGEDKKSLVIALVDQFVKIPWVPQFFLNDALSYAIDLVIAFLNTKIGNDWGTKILGSTPPAPVAPPPIAA